MGSVSAKEKQEGDGADCYCSSAERGLAVMEMEMWALLMSISTSKGFVLKGFIRLDADQVRDAMSAPSS